MLVDHLEGTDVRYLSSRVDTAKVISSHCRDCVIQIRVKDWVACEETDEEDEEEGETAEVGSSACAEKAFLIAIRQLDLPDDQSNGMVHTFLLSLTSGS